MLKLFIPRGRYAATIFIAELNILVFLAMALTGVNVVSPSAIDLMHWGAIHRPEVTGGEWWRLLTCVFVHGGYMHLLLNLYGFVIVALFVEPIFGHFRYLFVYLFSGICGSLCSIMVHSNTVSVGASGAIFGLYGAILGLLFTNSFPIFGQKIVFFLLGIYVAVNLFQGFQQGNIDNAAHIGGLIGGAISGVMMYSRPEKHRAL